MSDEQRGIDRPFADSVGFANLLRSEWTKFRSVRSTYWTIIVAAVLSLGITALITWRIANDAHLQNGGNSFGDPTTFSLNSLFLAQVAFGVLGVLLITSEYGTGMIRASLSAVPQRGAFLAAKGVVVLAVTFVIGELLSFAVYLTGQAILAGANLNSNLGQPQVLRAVVGGGLYLTAVSMLGFALGALVRVTAGGVSAFFFVLFALTPLVDLLPTTWRNHLINYMPINAGAQILQTQPSGSGALGPWTGLGVLCLWALVPLVGAFILIERRDA